jgi:hypothetical protein
MSFKPFSETYKFDETVLTKDFPAYLAESVETWLRACIRKYNLRDSSNYRSTSIDPGFKQQLQLALRRTFSADEDRFIATVISDPDLLCNVMSYLLQKYCEQDYANTLRIILRRGSSAYTVLETANDIQSYQIGVFELGWQVPPIVSEQSKDAIEANDLLMEAWNECYKHNPSPSSAVSKSIDFLEGFLRDKYHPEMDRTPPIYQYVKDFTKDPSSLSFRGSSFLSDTTKLIALLEGTSKIRAEHTTGEGREATSEEAEFVLHTTIYLWNLMR